MIFLEKLATNLVLRHFSALKAISEPADFFPKIGFRHVKLQRYSDRLDAINQKNLVVAEGCIEKKMKFADTGFSRSNLMYVGLINNNFCFLFKYKGLTAEYVILTGCDHSAPNVSSNVRFNPIHIGVSGAAWYWGGAESTLRP